MDDRGLYIAATWAAALLLWTLFRLYYDGLRRPLRAEEVDAFLASLGDRMDETGNDAARLRTFLEADDGREFVMLNLVRTRPGLITDPDQLDLQGVYETRSALGTDRFCAIGNRDAGYEIGVLAVFGRDSQCEARGRATINGDELQIELNEHPEGEVSGAEGEAIKACQFTAFFDGTVVRLPGELPKVCDSICSDRASFAGVNFQLVEQGLPAATRTRGRGFKRLCAVR